MITKDWPGLKVITSAEAATDKQYYIVDPSSKDDT